MGGNFIAVTKMIRMNGCKLCSPLYGLLKDFTNGIFEILGLRICSLNVLSHSASVVRKETRKSITSCSVATPVSTLRVVELIRVKNLCTLASKLLETWSSNDAALVAAALMACNRLF